MDRGLSPVKPHQLEIDDPSAFVILIFLPPSSVNLRRIFLEQWLYCTPVLTLSRPKVSVFSSCVSGYFCCKSDHVCYLWIWVHDCWSFSLLLYIISVNRCEQIVGKVLYNLKTLGLHSDFSAHCGFKEPQNNAVSLSELHWVEEIDSQAQTFWSVLRSVRNRCDL